MGLQDSSSFAKEGEELSFLQLQARAMEVDQILVGFYDVPRSVEQPLQLVINPEVLGPYQEPEGCTVQKSKLTGW